MYQVMKDDDYLFYSDKLHCLISFLYRYNVERSIFFLSIVTQKQQFPSFKGGM